jgi:hypothetical protein
MWLKQLELHIVVDVDNQYIESRVSRSWSADCVLHFPFLRSSVRFA